VTHHAKAPSAGSSMRHGRSRGLFGLACLCLLALAAFLGSSASSAGATGACPNEAIRVAQHATQLADCRAFEKVTPADKGGGDIVAEGTTTTAAADGNAVAFESRMGFAGSEGSGDDGRTNYLARRGAGGWETHAISPRPQPEAPGTIAGTAMEAFSEDLTTSLTRGYELPGAPDSTPARMNLYLENTASRDLRTITRSQTGEGDPMQYPVFDFLSEQTWGSSADLSHTSFVSSGQMVPAIPGEYPNGASNVYTWDEGIIHLAGILPDGTIPPGGSSVEHNIPGVMSADGSRQVFSASPASGPPQLYLRIDHSRTDLVSESENPAFTEEPQEVNFEGMTPDGRTVFFNTPSPLLEGDENEGPDIYRWTYGPDPEHESNLTLITSSGQAGTGIAGRGSLVGMSDDGERVYTYDNGGKLSVWNEGTATVITNTSSGITSRDQFTVRAESPGYGRVTADGNWLAYVSLSQLYLYDLTSDTLSCVSCPGGISTHPFAFTPNLTQSGRNMVFRPRYLSSNGRLFFTSDSSFVPEDTNGVADVYEYDGSTGRLSLVSSGSGGEPSEFVDASRSGDDVFFMTRQQLLPSDGDEFVDIYDARVGGGFDEPEGSPATPCSGEACQAASGAPGTSPGIGSGATGRGNVKQSRPCPRNRHKVRLHGKVSCVKHHGRRRHRSQHAGGNRGGAR